MSTVTRLPVWKKNATAAERLTELAAMALEKPELFAKMIIVHMAEGDVGLDWHAHGNMSLAYGTGLLELGKLDMIQRTKDCQ